MLRDLVEKEKGYRNKESTFQNESNVESSSDREEEGEKIASVNGSEDEHTQESNNATENDSEETKSSSPETSTTFHSENLCEHCEKSSVYGIFIIRCPKCFLHDSYKIWLYMITRSKRREITSRRVFFGVTIVEQLHTKLGRRWKPIFILLLKRGTKKTINSHPFQITVYFIVFVIGFQ